MSASSRFIIFTRGRTGSTAIVDEIDSHSRVACLQEPFIPLEGVKALLERIDERGEIDFVSLASELRFIPFEIWIKQYQHLSLFGKSLYRKGFVFHKAAVAIREYLNELEQNEVRSMKGDLSAFGFKLLVNHLNNWPSLATMLKDDGYKVIYLERKNVVRKVLSGIIAQKRGVYNRKNFQPEVANYEVDLDDFEMRVHSEIMLVEREKEQLKQQGFPVFSVAYEDFLLKREQFLEGLFDFIGVEFELPEKSEYSIMIQELSDTISNYDALKDRVEKMGMLHFLDS
ncbi:hypothetical protein Ga0123461_1882 [Mariprofundus aestuarium]|uniref:LPS sulfotransferase NodH n=1 Tax=Mariprofundus aestuarium TaxID=1921086 RepID=A0A2K8L5N7_MARES|nr:hypothetical protein [Mariprofundus aestuarium]ATX80294.1 hypothetical protein Ga0123461_1882 [Mariprofundus aestuarium]